MKKKLPVFFLSLCLGAGLGYALIFLSGEYGRGREDISSASRHAFQTAPGIRNPVGDPLPLSRDLERKRAFQSAFTGEPLKDWNIFLNRNPLLDEFEAISLLTEYWGRHCPRQAWLFLSSPEFREKSATQVTLRHYILAEWSRNQPEQVRELCEGILENPSSCSREDISAAKSQLPACLASESAENNLKWAFSLEEKEKGGLREDVLSWLLGSAGVSGKNLDEWCEAIQKIAPTSELSKEWGRRLLLSSAGVEQDQEEFSRWAGTFSLNEGHLQISRRTLSQFKSDKETEEETVKLQDRFEQEGDYSRILSDIPKEEKSRMGKAFEEWNSRNEESFRQYAVSLPEGERRKQALLYLAGNAENMEYQDRLALFARPSAKKDIYPFAVNNLLVDISNNDHSGREVDTLLDSAAFLSEREKESYRALLEGVQPPSPRRISRMTGYGTRFYRKADNPFRSYRLTGNKDGFERKEYDKTEP